MQKLNVTLHNCYGIKKLNYEFDFLDDKIYSIYASNGIMKTSFAKTFRDLSKNNDSEESRFPGRTTVREIIDENGTEIRPEQIFVIEPYNEQYSSEKESMLLVNNELKEEYEAIHKNIDKERENLIKNLRPLSGLSGRTNNIEKAIVESFDNNNLMEIFDEIESEVLDENKPKFANISYAAIFIPRVISLLDRGDFKTKIQEYIDRFDQLIESSSYLKKGFNHYHASEVQDNLDKQGFFSAEHSVNLFDGQEKKEIMSKAEFETVIEEEKTRVFKDSELLERFEAIDKQLTTVELRAFRDYLLENKEIIIELLDYPKFRIAIWISYMKKEIELFKSLLQEYRSGKQRIKEIVIQARTEETEWKNVIDIFNKRFSVPFTIQVGNQDDVILKGVVPAIDFTFKESGEERNVDKNELLRTISSGEKKALYILNIIFEVEARKKAGQKTVFIIDDIADSFDYKNKYAIIEYLKDISEIDFFNQIILTHNFDFHRTISGRLIKVRSNRLNTIKSESEIKLIKERYQKNPFSHWKDRLDQDDSMLIASIPFIRNITKYCGDEDNCKKLTSLLHKKQDTDDFTLKNLEDIYKEVLKDQNRLLLSNPDKKIVDLIYEVADSIYSDPNEIIELENKIVLSIAIRLKTESFIINKLNDGTFVDSITRNQTFELIDKYKEMFSEDTEEIKLLEQVNLMTPETIHINSFMYEPILDMSNHHLKELYHNIKSLT